MKLFDRVCRVTIRRTVESTTADRFFVTETAQTVITGLRVQFRIERHLNSEPNTCAVTITNLAPETRAELQLDGTVVSIAAGHDGVARHLFTGDVKRAPSVRDGADRHTQILLADGVRAYAQARAQRSYRAGTPVLTVLRDAASSMGLLLPKELESSSELRASFAAGYALEGATRDELTRLLAPFGYTWSIQDGKLQILRDDQVAPGAERLISSGPDGSGMIDVPTFAFPKATKKRGSRKPVLTVANLLYPELVPGCAIRVISEEVNGRFKLDTVTHEGDTHGDGWTTTMEAKSL